MGITMVPIIMVSHRLAIRTITTIRMLLFQQWLLRVHMARLAKLDQAEVAAPVLRIAVTTAAGDEDGIGESEGVGREVLERKLQRQSAESQLPVNMNVQSKIGVTGRHANVSGPLRNLWTCTDTTQGKNSKEDMLKIRTRIHIILNNNNSNTVIQLCHPTTRMPLRMASIPRASNSHHRQEPLPHSFRPRRQLPHMLQELRTIPTTTHRLQGLHLPNTPATSPVAATQILTRLVAVVLMRT